MAAATTGLFGAVAQAAVPIAAAAAAASDINPNPVPGPSYSSVYWKSGDTLRHKTWVLFREVVLIGLPCVAFYGLNPPVFFASMAVGFLLAEKLDGPLTNFFNVILPFRYVSNSISETLLKLSIKVAVYGASFLALPVPFILSYTVAGLWCGKRIELLYRLS